KRVVAELQVLEVEGGRAGLPLGLVDFAAEGGAGRVFGDVFEAEDRLALTGLDSRTHREPGARGGRVLGVGDRVRATGALDADRDRRERRGRVFHHRHREAGGQFRRRALRDRWAAAVGAGVDVDRAGAGGAAGNRWSQVVRPFTGDHAQGRRGGLAGDRT